jgi:tellurite resistance protein TerC
VAAELHRLSYGLAVIPVFISAKMLLVSLGVVVAMLAITMIATVKTAPRIQARR